MIGEQVICVDASYTPGQLSFWSEHGVRHPLRDKIYTIRTYQRHTNGLEGIRVEEIINPEIPVKSAVLGVINMEPSFKLSRFRTLMGDEVKKEVIEEVEVN